ncbi:MAG: ImmA/IrrE family metallo-endopeptidase [Ramlibacter sp.]
MINDTVEEQVAALHIEIWKHKNRFFPLGAPPEQMCQPHVAAQVMGLEYVEVDGLGRFGNGRERFETAGSLDRPNRIIAVSTRFSYPVRRFTGAHEIGHFAMHDGEIMHRDRPVFDISPNRPRHEKQADRFAAAFLAAPNLVRAEFQKRFGTKHPLPLNDTVAFYLTRGAGQELLGAPSGSLRFGIALATAQSFGNGPFTSLTSHFGVSGSAMALRLRELELIID